VIRHRFEYRAPREIDEALHILAGSGDDCAVLGSGTWLIPNMTFAAHQPKVVLDLKHRTSRQSQRSTTRFSSAPARPTRMRCGL
jgi:CO/xanthine dehydrogenase FAD-binding subunit